MVHCGRFTMTNTEEDSFGERERTATLQSPRRRTSEENLRGAVCQRLDQGPVWYLQVLPPHVDGSKCQLHLFPAGVLVSLVRNLNEDEEDPGHDAASDQHEDT